MESEKIKIETLKKVAVLVIDNPPANALSPDLRDEFMDKLNEQSKNDNIWTLIITGAGEKFFAAGADISTLLKLDAKSGLKRVQKSREFYNAVACLEKPVIAAINGICFGGGLELALACDIRIAAEHARLGLPEVKLGLIPGAGGTQRLPRAIGPGWANYMLYTGTDITAKKALEIGLVQEVTDFASLRIAALKLADKIDTRGPLAVRAAKRASAKGIQESLEKGLDIENKVFAELCSTYDKNEGITAFLEKRKAHFKGK